MTDIEAILGPITSRTRSRPFVFDGELLGELERVRSMRDQARKLEKFNPQGLGSEAEHLELEYRELVERAANAAKVLKARAVDADWLDELKRKHPPTENQIDQHREEAKQNPLFARAPVIDWQSAGPELLAKAIVSPEMTAAQWAELWASRSQGQRAELWHLVWGIQEEGSELPFSSAGTATTEAGAGGSSTPVKEESPSPS